MSSIVSTTLHNIKQYICEMDYNYKNPMSYVAVSIPGLSLVIEKIQISNLYVSKIAKDITENVSAIVFSQSENKKISHIACWHLAGNIVQLIAVVALASLIHPAIAAVVWLHAMVSTKTSIISGKNH